MKHAYAHPDSYCTMMNGPGYVTPRNSQTVAFNHPPRPSQPTEPVADHQRMCTKQPLSTVDQEEDAVIAYLNSKHDEWHNRGVRRSQQARPRVIHVLCVRPSHPTRYHPRGGDGKAELRSFPTTKADPPPSEEMAGLCFQVKVW